MADCLVQFQNGLANPIRVNPGVTYTGQLTNQFDIDYFDYEMAEQETVTFTIAITPETTNSINVELRLYGRDEFGNIQELGQAFLTEFNNTFTYDGVPGQYWFCLGTDFTISYSMTIDYTNYPYTLFPSFDAYAGSYMPVTDFAPGIRFCSEPVAFKIVDGVLPPGLTLSDSGQIYGVIEELDCYPPFKDDPPSWIKYMETEDGNIPITMDFPITVRAFFVNDPTGFYTDRQFTICVSNDWTPQRDAFNSTKDNMEQEIYALKEIPDGEDEIVAEEPTITLNHVSGPREEDTNSITTLQPLSQDEIKKLCEMCQINDEFAGLIEINKDGLCVPCEETEESISNLGIQDVNLVSPCIVCDEPEPISGIQDVVLKPLCDPCQIEEIEVETLPQMFRQVPGFQLPEFYNKITTEKACTPFYVEKLEDSYPMISEEKIKLKSLCPEVCE